MIAIGCDHGGFQLKEEIKKYFDEKKMEQTVKKERIILFMQQR